MYNTPEEIGAENRRNRNAANGYCPLDEDTLVPLDNIPSTLTGKTASSSNNADTVDTFDASQTVGTANTILVAGSDGTMPILLGR